MWGSFIPSYHNFTALSVNCWCPTLLQACFRPSSRLALSELLIPWSGSHTAHNIHQLWAEWISIFKALLFLWTQSVPKLGIIKVCVWPLDVCQHQMPVGLRFLRFGLCISVNVALRLTVNPQLILRFAYICHLYCDQNFKLKVLIPGFTCKDEHWTSAKMIYKWHILKNIQKSGWEIHIVNLCKSEA